MLNSNYDEYVTTPVSYVSAIEDTVISNLLKLYRRYSTTKLPQKKNNGPFSKFALTPAHFLYLFDEREIARNMVEALNAENVKVVEDINFLQSLNKPGILKLILADETLNADLKPRINKAYQAASKYDWISKLKEAHLDDNRLCIILSKYDLDVFVNMTKPDVDKLSDLIIAFAKLKNWSATLKLHELGGRCLQHRFFLADKLQFNTAQLQPYLHFIEKYFNFLKIKNRGDAEELQNFHANTLLKDACVMGSRQLVDFCLAQGASLFGYSSQLETTETPLSTAIFSLETDVDFIIWLRHKGARVTQGHLEIAIDDKLSNETENYLQVIEKLLVVLKPKNSLEQHLITWVNQVLFSKYTISTVGKQLQSILNINLKGNNWKVCINSLKNLLQKYMQAWAHSIGTVDNPLERLRTNQPIQIEKSFLVFLSNLINFMVFLQRNSNINDFCFIDEITIYDFFNDSQYLCKYFTQTLLVNRVNSLTDMSLQYIWKNFPLFKPEEVGLLPDDLRQFLPCEDEATTAKEVSTPPSPSSEPEEGTETSPQNTAYKRQADKQLPMWHQAKKQKVKEKVNESNRKRPHQETKKEKTSIHKRPKH